MDKIQAKWWHWCLAAVVLVLFTGFLGQRALSPSKQVYSQAIAAGSTPVEGD